jgi:hypothetical protein
VNAGEADERAAEREGNAEYLDDLVQSGSEG